MWLRHHDDDARRHGRTRGFEDRSTRGRTPRPVQDHAYELFQAKRGDSETQDWLRAERDILHESASRNLSGKAPGEDNVKFADDAGVNLIPVPGNNHRL